MGFGGRGSTAVIGAAVVALGAAGVAAAQTPYPFPSSAIGYSASAIQGTAGTDALVVNQTAGARDELTDTVLGTPQPDATISLGAGPDLLTVSGAGAKVDAGDGGDAIHAGPAASIDAGAGDDLVVAGDPGTDVDCGPGDDTLRYPAEVGPPAQVAGCEHVASGTSSASIDTAQLHEHVVGGSIGTQLIAGVSPFTFSLGAPAGATAAECSVDGAPWSPCGLGANPVARRDADGLRIALIRARLGDGSLSSTAWRRVWQDTTPPTAASFTSDPPAEVRTGQPVAFAGVAGTDIAAPRLEVSVTHESVGAYWESSTAARTFDQPGTYVVRLRSVDRAGNASAEVSRTVRVVPSPAPPNPGPQRPSTPLGAGGSEILTLGDLGLPASGRVKLRNGRLTLRCPADSCTARLVRGGKTVARGAGTEARPVALRFKATTVRRLRRGPLSFSLRFIDSTGRVLRARLVVRVR